MTRCRTIRVPCERVALTNLDVHRSTRAAVAGCVNREVVVAALCHELSFGVNRAIPEHSDRRVLVVAVVVSTVGDALGPWNVLNTGARNVERAVRGQRGCWRAGSATTSGDGATLPLIFCAVRRMSTWVECHAPAYVPNAVPIASHARIPNRCVAAT